VETRWGLVLVGPRALHGLGGAEAGGRASSSAGTPPPASWSGCWCWRASWPRWCP